MRRITGAAFLSLDGVIQGPGGPEEDPTGGFPYCGWMAGIADEGIGEEVGRLFTPPYDLLLGRRTYDIFAAYWPYVTGEERGFADALTGTTKHVVTHGDAPLTWANSHRLAGIDAVAALKRSEGPDLLIQGSGTLYPQLLAAGLIDILVTMTFPVLLGQGKRLFGAAMPGRALTMIEHRVTARGTVIARYEPAGEVATATFAGDEPSPAEHARRRRMAAGTW